MRMMVPTVLAEESKEKSAKNVKCSQTSCNRTHPEHPGRMIESRCENCVLTKETGETGKPRNRQARDQKREAGNRHGFAQSAHVTQILLTAQTMNDTACAEEQ